MATTSTGKAGGKSQKKGATDKGRLDTETESSSSSSESDTSYMSTDTEKFIVDNLDDDEREIYDQNLAYQLTRVAKGKRPKPRSETIKAAMRKTHPSLPRKVLKKALQQYDEQGDNPDLLDKVVIIKYIPAKDKSLYLPFKKEAVETAEAETTGQTEQAEETEQTGQIEETPTTSTDIKPEIKYETETDDSDDSDVEDLTADSTDKEAFTAALTKMTTAAQDYTKSLIELKGQVPDLTEKQVQRLTTKIPELGQVPEGLPELMEEYGQEDVGMILALGQAMYEVRAKEADPSFKLLARTKIANRYGVSRNRLDELMKGTTYYERKQQKEGKTPTKRKQPTPPVRQTPARKAKKTSTTTDE